MYPTPSLRLHAQRGPKEHQQTGHLSLYTSCNLAVQVPLDESSTCHASLLIFATASAMSNSEPIKDVAWARYLTLFALYILKTRMFRWAKHRIPSVGFVYSRIYTKSAYFTRLAEAWVTPYLHLYSG